MTRPFAPRGAPMSDAAARRWLKRLRGMPPETARQVLAGMPPGAVFSMADEWAWGRLDGQMEPEGDWRIWTIMAGRGFGKTRAGAEWAWARARAHPGARIALVGASLDEVAKVMVEGDSGLIAAARCDEAPRWVADRGLFHFPSGATAHAWTAARPEKLRGPQHDFAWCDELAKWPHAEKTWSNLMLGLRLGERPRTIVTTTPQPMALLKRILTMPACAPTHGRTHDNPHTAADYKAAVRAMFGGTRLGRQELDGVLFDDPEGALWTRAMLDSARGAPEGVGRVVIGLDPPASSDGDACGIAVCGLDGAGIAWVLADLTAAGLSPEGWARRVAGAARDWEASLIMAEQNQGGEMIEAMLRGVDAGLPVRLVPATRSKAARAEPVALAFETGKAKLAGSFPELEDQLCALTYQGFEGEGSPDRLDAMVWAMGELLRPAREPRIRRL